MPATGLQLTESIFSVAGREADLDMLRRLIADKVYHRPLGAGRRSIFWADFVTSTLRRRLPAGFYVFFGSLDRALLPLIPGWTSFLARNLLTLMLFSVSRNSMRLSSGQSLICSSE